MKTLDSSPTAQQTGPRHIGSFTAAGGRVHRFCSLPSLEKTGYPGIARLPISIRILLESALRNCGKPGTTAAHIKALANWSPDGQRTEVPLSVGRVVLQDFTGTPLVCDLAAMRDAMVRAGSDPALVEPQIPVQLVIDHSVQINHARSADALRRNLELEYDRNAERYAFFKWGNAAFENFTTVPPGFGIIHQVNLESLAKGVSETDGIWHPDTLVGTDSHTTMINGIGILGWGVGGIEAESAMLGQPVTLVAPDVVGVELTGRLPEGATITDAVLVVTERLRAHGVVGKFVEFFGAGAASLSATDRATIANMAPEYGATIGLFPTDDRTIDYFRATGRNDADVAMLEAYYKAQGMFGMPMPGDIDYSEHLQIDLGRIVPSVAGPKRPQDRIDLSDVSETFERLMAAPVGDGGYDRAAELERRSPVAAAPDMPEDLGQGDILIAAITSCTNTSNPEVLMTAGLLARNAVAAGLSVPPWIKTSFTPGSRVVAHYLTAAGLMAPLEKLGFGISAYGCGACAGNSGPLDPALDAAIAADDLVCAAVLSGNRNFEARIHPSIRANFLMSPPLVVAYALAGSIRVDLTSVPLRQGNDGGPVHLRDIWPSARDIEAALVHAGDAQAYRDIYAVSDPGGQLWQQVDSPAGTTYEWPASTYIARPPFFEHFDADDDADAAIEGASILIILGDSVTTDHISPAGVIAPDSPAGQWLQARGVAPAAFNTYGARRGHHEVMMRGAFSNPRLRNRIAVGIEGGVTRIEGRGEPLPIFDAAEAYRAMGRPLVIVAGREYGSGSSRDWAAKGTNLLGVRAVIAQSFERIHRSNLVGMGVIPCQWSEGVSAETLGLDGTERISLPDLKHPIAPRGRTRLVIDRADGAREEQEVTLHIDSAPEAEQIAAGGLGRLILRRLHAAAARQDQ